MPFSTSIISIRFHLPSCFMIHFFVYLPSMKGGFLFPFRLHPLSYIPAEDTTADKIWNTNRAPHHGKHCEEDHGTNHNAKQRHIPKASFFHDHLTLMDG